MSTRLIFAEVTSGGFFREYLSLMHDWPHYAFEYSQEVITGLILIPVWNRAKKRAVARAIKRHDATYHPHSHRSTGLDTDPDL